MYDQFGTAAAHPDFGALGSTFTDVFHAFPPVVWIAIVAIVAVWRFLPSGRSA